MVGVLACAKILAAAGWTTKTTTSPCSCYHCSPHPPSSQVALQQYFQRPFLQVIVYSCLSLPATVTCCRSTNPKITVCQHGLRSARRAARQPPSRSDAGHPTQGFARSGGRAASVNQPSLSNLEVTLIFALARHVWAILFPIPQ